MVSIVFFVASLIRSTFGFGGALIAVPLLALWMPIGTITPVAVLVSIVSALFIVIQDWHLVHMRSVIGLFGYSLLGMPVGLWLLVAVSESIVQLILAAAIVAFSAYSLFGRKHIRFVDGKFTWMFGFFSGVLGGAFGMNGPPLAMYGSLRGWSPQQFRATLQGFFLPAGIVSMGGYWMTGLWTTDVTQSFLYSLPGVVVAIVVGRLINKRLDGSVFFRVIHVGLIAIAAVLFAGSVWGR